MKKLFCLLAALLLALPCACAEVTEPAAETADPSSVTSDTRETDLLDIFRTDGESRTWITAAVQTMDGMLLASPALLSERTDSLVVSDGQNEWQAEAVIPDSTWVTAMVFFDVEQHLPKCGAWPLMPFGESVKASTCIVRYGNADGSRTECRVLNADSLRWEGNRCLLLELDAEVPSGAAVLNAKGELVGLVVADYAEGPNRVLALPVEEIVRGMSEAGALLTNLYSWGNPAEGFRVTTERNLVTIDWSAMTLPEKAEGETLYVVIADTRNDYLNFYPAEEPERMMKMILTPGRVYIFGVLAAAQAPSDLPEQYEVTVIPGARKLTSYGFCPTQTAVAEMPEDAKEGQEPQPVTEVTEELLRSGRAYFYSASTYQVEEKLPAKTLLVTLTDPEGNNYRYESSWLYDPEYMQDDVWSVPLSTTGLTYSLDRNGYPKGEYQMAYYVDGELADAFTFELK